MPSGVNSMKTIDHYGSFEDAIIESTLHTQELARRIRELIAEVYPGVVEVPWPNQQTVGYGIGPKKMSEHFCYIGVYRNHVNLGFNYGSDLPDPAHLLEGSGKRFRHVQFHSAEDVSRRALRRLLEVAVEERETTLGVEGGM